MITITDDGDEVVFFHVDNILVGEVDHGRYGWDGMTGVIELVESLATRLGVRVDNTQDIV